jgi:predicted outer membrane repeat protein
LEDRFVPAVFNVNSLADVLNPGPGVVTLRSAIQAANNTPGGNTINLTIPGTYRITLPGANTGTNNSGAFAILPTGGDLSIVNTSGGSVTIDGGGLDRVFDINPTFDPKTPTAPFTVTLEGFTIENGRAFDPTRANPDGGVASGGAIRDQGNASLTLTNVVVTNNSATADGGGIAMENAVSVPWTLTLNNTTVSNNRAGDAGGGVETDGSGKIFINAGTVITGNTSVNQGAGIWLDAIQVGDVFQGANLTVTGTLISSNTAIAAGNAGGGIGNAGNGTVTITGSTLADNFSGGVGGGFGDENAQGTLVVLNSTFVNNSAIGNGGGIEASGPSTTINDTTVTGNISQAQGGGLLVKSAAFTLNNTIVAGNFVNNNGGLANNNGMGMNFLGLDPDIFARVTMGSGNFIGSGDINLIGITNGTNGNQVGTVAKPLDPLLGPLQNNGGPTPTRAPLAGSPVIDTGVNAALPNGTTTDQRGSPRISNNTVDIGAVEFPTLTAPERFVAALYLDELGRAGSLAELDGWVAVLNGPGGSPAQVATNIAASFEARDHLVKGWYQTYLGRQAVNGEEQSWVNLLRSQTNEQVLSQILGSTEFAARAQKRSPSGTTDQQYVQALYSQLLNRTGSASEVAGWLGVLPQLGRQGVALQFLQSQEYRTIQVGSDYSTLLHRPGDAVGLTSWVLSKLDLANIRIGLEGSAEFFTNG